METSQRLALPFIQPGQAQKELFHNEALQLLDLIVAGAVEEPPRDAPPASPAPGNCYIVGATPTGGWSGLAGRLAGWTAAGWRFVAPVEGMSLYVRSSGDTATYRSGAWEIGRVLGSELVIGGDKVVGARAAAISAPAGGAVVDSEARAAIGAILAVLRGHGLIEA